MPGIEDPVVTKAATVRDLMGLYYITQEETDITNNYTEEHVGTPCRPC